MTRQSDKKLSLHRPRSSPGSWIPAPRNCPQLPGHGSRWPPPCSPGWFRPYRAPGCCHPAPQRRRPWNVPSGPGPSPPRLPPGPVFRKRLHSCPLPWPQDLPPVCCCQGLSRLHPPRCSGIPAPWPNCRWRWSSSPLSPAREYYRLPPGHTPQRERRLPGWWPVPCLPWPPCRGPDRSRRSHPRSP